MSLLSILSARREQALQAISNTLRSRPEYRRLSPEQSGYDAELVAWSVDLVAAGKKWETHVVLTTKFPDEPPLVRVPEAACLVLKNPHVLEDGSLCAIPDSCSVDSSNPVGLFYYVLESTKSILEDQRNEAFRDEFSVYWRRMPGADDTECLVIDSPETLPPSFRVLFAGKTIAVSSSPKTLNRWATNFFGETYSLSPPKRGVLLPLKAALLPSEYPGDLQSLLRLMSSRNAWRARDLLVEHIVSGCDKGLVLLAQKTGNGYALGGITYSGQGLKNMPSLRKGFRKSKVPSDILLKRSAAILSKAKIVKHAVKRVDYDWIHARGGDERDFQKKSVLIIGCGSLGGYLSHFLSRAGVSALTLVDKERLEWANLGRHILGADSVSRWKAEALGESLGKQMPHLKVAAIAKDWRDSLKENTALLYEHDLIVSTIGDWRSEGSLNLLGQKGDIPPVIFGWLEPYAVAGHCLVSVVERGCLACGMNRFGQFEKRVACFEGETLKREPGGCVQYQQYGPTALLPVASLISSEVLGSLRRTPDSSRLRTWISSEEHLCRVGAKIAKPWHERVLERGYGRLYSTEWHPESTCHICA